MSGTSSGWASALECLQLPSQADLPTEPGPPEESVGGTPAAAHMSRIEFSATNNQTTLVQSQLLRAAPRCLKLGGRGLPS